MGWQLRVLRILGFLFVILLGSLALSAFSAAAQQGASPPVPPRPVSSAREIVPTVPPAHRFWDRENVLLFSGIAVTRGMDYASTRNFQARGRQEILLPDVVVNNSAGFASLEAAGTMTSIGISYIFHRTGHHKLERWMSIGHIGVTAFGDIRNYCLETRHQR